MNASSSRRSIACYLPQAFRECPLNHNAYGYGVVLYVIKKVLKFTPMHSWMVILKMGWNLCWN